MSTFVDRMVRAARLDAQVYEEVEADLSATPQALGVVVLSSVAAGIGGAGGGLGFLIAATIGALIGWYIWAVLTYYIGTRLLPGAKTEATIGQLLRTTGFSSSPGIIRVIGIIGPLSAIAQLVAGVWMLVAMIIAVRQALDYESTGRAVAVCLVGFVVQLGVLVAVFMAFGPPPQ